MQGALVAVHILVSIALILIVLLQTGKGADISAVFGGASQTVFGSRGPASFLGKVTTAAAIIFMVTSLTLAYLAAHRRGGSLMTDRPVATQPASPAAPATPSAPAPPEKPAEPSASETPR